MEKCLKSVKQERKMRQRSVACLFSLCCAILLSFFSLIAAPDLGFNSGKAKNSRNECR